jgi:hypothetical protein
LRPCPAVSQQCRVLRTLPLATELRVEERQGEWLRISVPATGESGWVHGEYVDIVPRQSVWEALLSRLRQVDWWTKNRRQGLLIGALALLGGILLSLVLAASSGGSVEVVRRRGRLVSTGVLAVGIAVTYRTGYVDHAVYALLTSFSGMFVMLVVASILADDEAPTPPVPRPIPDPGRGQGRPRPSRPGWGDLSDFPESDEHWEHEWDDEDGYEDCDEL